MTDPFAGLEPVGFWRRFEALRRIPRATHEEERAVALVAAWAAERAFETGRDGAGNLVVRVPATAGRERAPTVILQGRLDIVCERDPDSAFDPRAGRIGVGATANGCAPTARRWGRQRRRDRRDAVAGRRRGAARTAGAADDGR